MILAMTGQVLVTTGSLPVITERVLVTPKEVLVITGKPLVTSKTLLGMTHFADNPGKMSRLAWKWAFRPVLAKTHLDCVGIAAAATALSGHWRRLVFKLRRKAVSRYACYRSPKWRPRPRMVADLSAAFVAFDEGHIEFRFAPTHCSFKYRLHHRSLSFELPITWREQAICV